MMSPHEKRTPDGDDPVTLVQSWVLSVSERCGDLSPTISFVKSVAFGLSGHQVLAPPY